MDGDSAFELTANVDRTSLPSASTRRRALRCLFVHHQLIQALTPIPNLTTRYNKGGDGDPVLPPSTRDLLKAYLVQGQWVGIHH